MRLASQVMALVLRRMQPCDAAVPGAPESPLVPQETLPLQNLPIEIQMKIKQQFLTDTRLCLLMMEKLVLSGTI